GEQREIGEEAWSVRVLIHIADGVEVHEGRYRGHDHQHHGRERIDAQSPINLELTRREPVHERNAEIPAAADGVVERNPRQHHGEEQQGGGGYLRHPRACRRRRMLLELAMRSVRNRVWLCWRGRSVPMAHCGGNVSVVVGWRATGMARPCPG